MADRTFNLLTNLSLNNDEFKKGVDAVQTNVKKLIVGVDGATGSLGEMKRAFMVLKNISFAGKSVEEIAAINKRIGQLKDEMGDLNAIQKGMGVELGTVMAGGLQTLAAVGEVGVGIASMFGASKESAEKYQKVMTTLIGVTQGLGVIEDALATKQFTIIATRIKATVVTVAQTVATKAATVAQWLLNSAMGGWSIGLIIAGVAALVIGLKFLIGSIQTTTEASKKHEEQLKAVAEQSVLTNDELKKSYTDTRTEYAKQELAIDNLVKKVKDEKIGLGERKKALDELIKLDPTYLNGLTLQNIAYDEGVTKIMNYKKALFELADAKAMENTYIKLKSQYIENELAIQQKQGDISKGIQDRELVATGKLNGSYSDLVEQVGYYNSATGKESGTGKLTKDLNDLSTAQYATATSLSFLMGKMNNTNTPDVKFNTGGSTGGSKNTSEPKGLISTDIQILNKRLANERVLYKSGADKILNIKKDFYNKFEKSNMISIIPEPDPLPIKKTIGEWKKTLIDFNIQLSQQIENMAVDLSSKIGEAFVKMFDSSTSNKDKWKSFGAGILSSIGGFMKSLGQQLVVMGGLAEVIQTALATIFVPGNFASATALIVAGIAFVAAGSVLSSIAGKGFANGGIVPGSSYSGDRVPIMANSAEMILNSSQQSNLFNMIKGNQIATGGLGSTVKFEIEGTKLVGVLSNQSKKVSNTR